MRPVTGWKSGWILLGLVLLLMLSSCAAPDPAAAAWDVCTMFVRARTGIPTEDAERYKAGGVTELTSDRYRVKVYYAKAGGSYQCEVLRRPDENWQLLKLEFVR